MVRNIVGLLVEIGRGRLPVAAMADLLAARDRRLAPPPAPPHGLCLEWVRYP
jgi:tRNA pseudouridine38-40 synthase